MANGSYYRWQGQNQQADAAQGEYKDWVDTGMPNRQALQDEAETKYDVSGAQNAYKTARDNVKRVQTAMATLPEIERSMSQGLSAAQAGTLLGQNTNRYSTTLAQLLPSAQLTSDDYNMAVSNANAMGDRNYSAGMDRGNVLNDFWKTLLADANSAYAANQADRGAILDAVAAQASDTRAREVAAVEEANMAAYLSSLAPDVGSTSNYEYLPTEVDQGYFGVDTGAMTPEQLAEYERQKEAYLRSWTTGLGGGGNQLADILFRMQPDSAP
jgi:hypothetical protein